MFYLTELPLDMQQHVWTFVEHPRDLGRLHATCKHLDQTVPPAASALVVPIMRGFAELINGNRDPLRGVPATFGFNSVMREGKHPVFVSNNVNGTVNGTGQRLHSIIGINMIYRFSSNELVLEIQAVQNPLSYVLPVTYMCSIKGQDDVLDLLKADKTLHFSSVPTHREPDTYTFTMRSLDILKDMFTTFEANPRLRSRNNRYTMATIHIPPFDQNKMHVPESLYKAMSRLKYARKIRISNGKVDVAGLDNYLFFEKIPRMTMSPPSYMRP